MTAFILAVIVNNYSTGQVSGACAPAPPRTPASRWPRAGGLQLPRSGVVGASS